MWHVATAAVCNCVAQDMPARGFKKIPESAYTGRQHLHVHIYSPLLEGYSRTVCNLQCHDIMKQVHAVLACTIRAELYVCCLFAHVVMCATAALIRAACKGGEFDRALHLLSDMKQHGIKPRVRFVHA
jgi:pentatricopeptide repeat protein